MPKTKISDREYDHCIYNASGVRCREKDELIKLYDSQAPIILSKSCTLDSREGNLLPRYFDNDLLSINSSGLPNMGFSFYNELDFKNKDYFLSIAGMKPEDNIHMISNLNSNSNSNINGIELNLSCPNIAGKSQVGYDFVATEEILRKASEILDNKNLVFGIKLPPYFDEIHFNNVADIINNSKVNSITCVNSIGNGLVIDSNSETVVIKPKNGFGGLGGKIIKPIALANVHKFYNLTKCSIIGCGGIFNGHDAFEHILCGASAIQIGTCLYQEGPKCFKRIENELEDIMMNKNYNEIEDFRGTLKYL